MKFQYYKSFKQYRLTGYDYSGKGNYFITICTGNREEYFGTIENNGMKLSAIGNIVEKTWNIVPSKFQNVSLDISQIMPDHFHAILIINETAKRHLINQMPTDNVDSKNEFISGIRNNPMELEQISLGYIIRWFKAKVRNEASKINPQFHWQSRYYDRIIRSNREFYLVQEYIANNVYNSHNAEEDMKFIEGLNM
jgi:REP element-mobilizing transposase RayT